MDDVEKIVIISTRSGELLRERVIPEFNLKLSEVERNQFEMAAVKAKNFPSGEEYVQLPENVRRRRIHVIAGVYRPDLYHLRRKVLGLDDGSVGVKLVRDYLHSVETDYSAFLKILDAARRSGAQEISVYMTYFPDCRQDKKDEPRVPISAKLRFDQLESAGSPKLSRIGVIDIHAQQEQGFTNLPVDQITAKNHLLLALKRKGVSFEDLILVCADPNDYKSTKKLSDRLGVGLAIIEKSRAGHGETDGEAYIAGMDVEGRTCAMVDDMVDTGGTIFRGLDVLRQRKVGRVYVCATHGLFSPKINTNGKVIFTEDLFRSAHEESGLEVIVTDTIARSEEYLKEHKAWLTSISVAPLIADLIYCNETGTSHGEKLEGYKQLARDDDGSALDRFMLSS
ncbi:MAG: ribose-phosphate diphosphokinase [Candidatus Woesearchaeota archaeon]